MGNNSLKKCLRKKEGGEPQINEYQIPARRPLAGERARLSASLAASRDRAPLPPARLGPCAAASSQPGCPKPLRSSLLPADWKKKGLAPPRQGPASRPAPGRGKAEPLCLRAGTDQAPPSPGTSSEVWALSPPPRRESSTPTRVHSLKIIPVPPTHNSAQTHTHTHA